MTVSLENQISACLLQADGLRSIVQRTRNREIKRSDLDLERYRQRIEEMEAAARTLQWVADNADELRALK